MLDWFEPGLMSNDPPDWISNYSEFTSELKCNFGPHNPEGDVENELKALRMKDNQWMVKYLVDFNRLAAQVTWGDSALRHQLYKGLPNRKTIHPLRNAPIDSADQCVVLGTSIRNILGIQEV